MTDEQKKKILLLDDDVFLRDIYTKKFTEDGYETKAFPNVNDAISEIEAGYVPELVLSDVIMPNKTAWDFLKYIRDNNLIPDAKIILLTNEDNESNIERSKEFGVSGYVIKALMTPSEVVEKVKEIYNSK